MNIAADARSPAVTPSSVRGQERVSRILEAATELFLKDGYDSTAMDAIVEKSGGSKATLYSYFPTKADLFRSVVDNIVATEMPALKIDTCENIRATLQAFGEGRLRVLLSPRHLALVRLVISERDRFPDLAQTYYDRGPRVGHESLASYITALRDNQKLDVDDVDEAAGFFIGMLMHDWYKQYVLFPTNLPTDAQISKRVARVVEHFLALYHRQDAGAKIPL